MRHRFIVNTENVNEYGYRVLTDGIDTTQYEKNPVVLYMHHRSTGKSDGTEVIGRCVNLEKKENILYADVEFDMADEFAAKIAGKVERGFVRMASMYADVKATSSDEADVLPGQTLETVTKCKLVEISIVDIGGNDDAIKLSHNSGKALKLARLSGKSKSENTEMNLKTVALAMGMQESSTTEQILGEVQKLKLAKENAEAKIVELENKIKESEKSEADSLVSEAVQLGLIPSELKETMLSAFESDFNGQKVKLSAMISKIQEELVKDGRHQAVTQIVLGAQGANATAGAEDQETFDFLSKKNPIKLAKIREEDPKRYQQLAADYANGIRHIEK